MRTLLCSLALFVTYLLFGHNPHSAKFELHERTDGAVFHAYLSQAGVHQALKKAFPDEDFHNMAIGQYKKVLIEYLKCHVRLAAEGGVLPLGVSAIKLGNHQTEVRIALEDYPDEVKLLEVQIDAFSENKGQQSIFWWVSSEENKAKCVLSARNDFSAAFSGEDSLLQQVAPTCSSCSEQPPMATSPTAKAGLLVLTGAVALLLALLASRMLQAARV